MPAVIEELRAARVARAPADRRPPVVARFPEELEREVEALARRADVSKSEVVRVGARRLVEDAKAEQDGRLLTDEERETFVDDTFTKLVTKAQRLVPSGTPMEQVASLREHMARALRRYDKRKALSPRERAFLEECVEAICADLEEIVLECEDGD